MTSRAFIALALSWLSVPAHAEEPQVGDLFEIKPGDTFRGWKSLGGGCSGRDCRNAHEVFNKGDDFILAVTEVVTRGPRGGTQIERIVILQKTQVRPNETWATCDFNGEHVPLTFLDKTSKIVRGLFVVGDTVHERRWLMEPDDCYLGE